MGGPAAAGGAGVLRLRSAAGRWVVTATVLGSGMALLDSTVVNVALPTIGRDLGASLAGLQWTVNGYTLSLAGLILLGVTWFALASALSGLAPSIGVLIGARILQGIGGALLTPGSLAIIQASFAAQERPRAVGAWSGLGGVAGAAGPLLGGWIVVAAGWRWVFLINLPIAAATLAVTARHVPESRDPSVTGRFDVAGAALAALSLAGITYALIGAASASPAAVGAAAGAGAGAGAGFVWLERRRDRARTMAPMLPLEVFASRQFTVINVVTFLVYGAFGGMIFLLVLELQVVSGYSALAAGTALLPVTLLMLALSARAGALAQRVGPRWLMTGGTALCALGVLALSRIGPAASYPADVLPAVTVFGLGLSATVAPLTATVLASADVRHAGVASGVNNAVARAAGLLAVAALPALAGLSAGSYHHPVAFFHGFQAAMYVCAGLLGAGSALCGILVDNRVLRPRDGQPVPAPECRTSCTVGAPPLEHVGD